MIEAMPKLELASLVSYILLLASRPTWACFDFFESIDYSNDNNHAIRFSPIIAGGRQGLPSSGRDADLDCYLTANQTDSGKSTQIPINTDYWYECFFPSTLTFN